MYQAINNTIPNATNAYISLSSSVVANTLTQANATAVINFTVLVKGTVSIATGGTFIPQYTLSAAPGGAYSTQAGSYMKISPISNSAANTSIGAWA
jgi:hypothetical protein